jgi:hypothetical protein
MTPCHAIANAINGRPDCSQLRHRMRTAAGRDPSLISIASCRALFKKNPGGSGSKDERRAPQISIDHGRDGSDEPVGLRSKRVRTCATLACSPISDPSVMRVSEALRGKERLDDDQTTEAEQP